MPRMNGIELIQQMKGHEKFKSLPVMVVSYKNTEEDRLKGMEAGANYYLTKSSFQDNSFIEAVLDLIGEP
jgi:two-component system sensor histidine kinase and response regulator WspE